MAISNLTPVEEWPARKLPQDRFDDAVKTAMDQMSVMVGELNSAFIPQTNEAIDTINDFSPNLPAILDAPNQAAAAAASAQSAASSKTAAAQSATEAASSKTAAAQSATEAASSKTAAAQSATEAASSKTAAAQSAATAKDEADSAAQSATEAASSKTAAAQSATEAASSKTAAAQSATEAASSKTAAATSAQQAKSSATTATSEANRAKEEADRAASVVAVDIATPEKAGIVKPDGTITTTDSDGTLKVSTFTGSKNGLVPASGAAAGKVLQGDGTWKELPVFTGSKNGLVPASGAAAGKVLQGDGTWEYTEDATASMTISADLHLTADSPRALVLTAAASGLSVYLPDHSTLPRGTVFHIFVRSPEDIQLRDFSGQAVKAYPVLSASTATRIQLIDATAGLWALASFSQSITSDAPGPRGLSIGDQFIFSSSIYVAVSMDILSEQKAIVFYGTSNGPYAVVLSVSDTDIVVGDAVKVSSSYSSTYVVAALSADKAIVCYVLNNINYTAVLSISGMTITVGDPTQISGAFKSLTALSADKAICGYISGSNVGLDLLSISGNTVTKVKNLSLGTGGGVAVEALSETTALVCLDGENSQVIKVSVSGNSIVKEASQDLRSTAHGPSLTALSEEKALVAYKNANALGCVKVVTLSGSAVYVGPELVCSTRRLQAPSVAALSEKSAVVCFLDADGPRYGLVYGLSINQDTVRVIEEKVFNFNPTTKVAARRLSPSRVLAAFISGTGDIGVAETITLL